MSSDTPRRVAVLAGIALGVACAPRADSRATVTGRFSADLATLDATLGRLENVLAVGDFDEARRQYRVARRAYKRAEPMIEAVFPPLGFLLNNRSPDADHDEAPPPPQGWETTGFPAFEPFLFGGARRTGDSTAAAVVHHARGTIQWALDRLQVLSVGDTLAFPAARLGIARLATLDLAGYDAPPDGGLSDEWAASLDGLEALGAVLPQPHAAAYRAGIIEARAIIRSQPSVDAVDRLAVIVRGLRPAALALEAARRADRRGPMRDLGLWRGDAATPFEVGALRAAAAPGPFDVQRAARLGAMLFTDARLSDDRTRSCATCHRPDRAFADGMARPTPRAGHRVLLRNVPSLTNVALQVAWFADGRATALEDQVGEVLTSPEEMGASLDALVARLRRDADLMRDFAAAFGLPPDRAVTPTTIRLALAAHLRTLVDLDTPVDRALRGDTMALSAAARRGLTVYMGKARCGTCHFLPLTNGVVPPRFHEQEVEVIGVPDGPRGVASRRLSDDVGRGAIDGLPQHIGAFRPTSLRHVALTAPYFHNGAFATLDDVLDFYDAGGGAGRGLAVPMQTLPADSLHLTREDRIALLAFLRALGPNGSTP